MTPDLCDSWGTHAHAHLTSKSGAPCKQCPEAGQPLQSGRRIPLLLLKMFGHHDVHCNSHILSPRGIRGLTPGLPWKSEAGRQPSLPALMMLRRASHVHPMLPLPVPRKRGPSQYQVPVPCWQRRNLMYGRVLNILVLLSPHHLQPGAHG